MSDSLLKRDWEKICPKAEKEREDSRVNILKRMQTQTQTISCLTTCC